MEIRKFRRAYDLELIPASHEAISLGDLVWDPVFGPPAFNRKGMPNTIFSAFLDAGLLDQEEWTTFHQECRQTPLVDARLATRTVDVDLEVVSELQHPRFGKIEGEFLRENLSKFTFGDLQVRTMHDLLRVRVDAYLEELKAGHWSAYDGRIRRVFMITELYYGAIKLVVEKRFSNELESRLKDLHIEAKFKTESSHAVEYAFSHEQVPFAMRIERIRNFNG